MWQRKNYYAQARVGEYPTYIRNIKRKATWIGHNRRTKFLLEHFIEGKIVESVEVMGRRGRGFQEVEAPRF
jgi:hypothetical protein